MPLKRAMKILTVRKAYCLIICKSKRAPLDSVLLRSKNTSQQVKAKIEASSHRVNSSRKRLIKMSHPMTR